MSEQKIGRDNVIMLPDRKKEPKVFKMIFEINEHIANVLIAGVIVAGIVTGIGVIAFSPASPIKPERLSDAIAACGAIPDTYFTYNSTKYDIDPNQYKLKLEAVTACQKNVTDKFKIIPVRVSDD